MILIFQSSLGFASIALLTKREIKIITEDANPILSFILCVRFYFFMRCVFDGC